MKALAYPLRHVSIRVPWHDNGWGGTVCNQPRQNTACLKLVNIAESKVEADEEAMRGQSLKDMDPARFPPCVKERGTFMAPFQWTGSTSTRTGAMRSANTRTTATRVHRCSPSRPARWCTSRPIRTRST